MIGNRPLLVTLLAGLAACADVVDPGPTGASIACDVDDETFVFESEASARQDGSVLLLEAGAGLVSQDDVTLRVPNGLTTGDLGDPFAETVLMLTLDFDAFTSRNLKGTVEVTELTNDRVVGTFEAEVVNTTDPNDVRTVRNGVFDVPLR